MAIFYFICISIIIIFSNGFEDRSKYPIEYPDGYKYMPKVTPGKAIPGYPLDKNYNVSLDPGGYTPILFLSSSTLNSQDGPQYNPFYWGFGDYGFFSYIGEVGSNIPYETWNCTLIQSGVYTTEYFLLAPEGLYCTNPTNICCKSYLGKELYYSYESAKTFVLAQNGQAISGLCDLQEMDETLFCAFYSENGGMCLTNVVKRNVRNVYLACLENFYVYFVKSCPVFKILGAYVNCIYYEPPLYMEKMTISDSITISAVYTAWQWDRVCIPVSYATRHNDTTSGVLISRILHTSMLLMCILCLKM